MISARVAGVPMPLASFKRSRRTSPRGSLGKDQLRRLRDYVAAHLDEPIGVEARADIAARSPFHFTRVFTRSVGMTPHRYVVHLRLQHALELVREGRSGLAEIAAAPALPTRAKRNNFRSALQEQNKVGSGGAFFGALLLILLAIGAAGLQVQTVLSRWRDYRILQAVGFTPGQVLVYYGLQFALVLSSGIAIAAIASVALSSIPATSLILAAGLAALAAGLASLPVLLWPVRRTAAELLRDTA